MTDSEGEGAGPSPARRTGAAAPPPHGIERRLARAALGLASDLPFRGEDLWTGYEFSWLNAKGKPQAAGLRLAVPCASPRLAESKSLKLYLNSFADRPFASRAEVLRALDADLESALGAPAGIELLDIERLNDAADRLPGLCLDDLDIEVAQGECNPGLLQLADSTRRVSEAFHTHLFRSLCPMTGQPDWASILVQYAGPPLQAAGLLQYLVSFRCHAAFHEHVVERIFIDLLRRCRPERLTVLGRFLRRGGLDINPFRSTDADRGPSLRLPRQ